MWWRMKYEVFNHRAAGHIVIQAVFWEMLLLNEILSVRLF
jgi:hypothetical protein